MRDVKPFVFKKQYAVIGDGPASIMVIMALIAAHVSEKDILWIGPEFKVGAFGKQWKNVPGNTPVDKYLKAYNDLFAILKNKYAVKRREFLVDILKEDFSCSLKIAAEPLQYITNILRNLVTAVEGLVIKLNQTSLGLELTTETHSYLTQTAIVAIGAKPKAIPLPPAHSQKALSLETVLDIKSLEKWVEQELKIHQQLRFAIVGSSHSAALAIMHLYQIKQEKNLPIDFKQFANKEYQFATGALFDNTGLKGKVAIFMKKLLASGWKPIIGNIENFDEFTHIVSATGLEPVDTLEINGISSANIAYDHNTGATAIPGLFMVGSGHPRRVLEQGKLVGNVGVGKFIEDSKKSVTTWISSPSPLRSSL